MLVLMIALGSKVSPLIRIDTPLDGGYMCTCMVYMYACIHFVDIDSCPCILHCMQNIIMHTPEYVYICKYIIILALIRKHVRVEECK